jgi:hypothetical protein
MFFHSFVACVGQDSNVGALYLFRWSPIRESNQRSDTNGTNTTSRKLWPLGVGHPGVCVRGIGEANLRIPRRVLRSGNVPAALRPATQDTRRWAA